jgi:hypothetical protein
MFVVVTLIALWLGWELRFVRERQTWLREHGALTVKVGPNPSYVPKKVIAPWRIWMGDSYVPQITFPKDWSDQDRARPTRLFPEAHLFRLSDSGIERIDVDPWQSTMDALP